MSQIRTLVVTATRSGGISTVIVNRVSSANLASTIHGATSKATPLDADEIPLADSAASWVLKKLTWANLKATVKTYFDTLYATAAQGELADTALQSVPTASADTLGVIKVGSGLTITDGVLSVSGGSYTLPIAQTGTLGGIQPSDDITVNATTGVATVNGVTDSSGSSDAGKFIKLGADGQFSISSSITEGSVVSFNASDAANGTNTSSIGGVGLLSVSQDSTGAWIYSLAGTYHAQFGASTAGDNRSFIARVLGAFGWWRGAYTGIIQAAATLTANRTWSLPDKNGTVAMTSDITGTNSGTNTGDETVSTIATKLNAGTEDTAAADTDRIAVTSPAGGWMSLTTLWTWITGKADSRYARLSQLVESTAQIDATGTTQADVTGMTGVTLLANTWYRLEFAGQVTTTTGASWQIEMATTQNLARTSGVIPSINNAGNTAVGQLSFQTSQRLIIAQRSTTGTAVNNTAIALFKTGANAPTVKITFAQWTSPAGTASLLSGAVAVFTKVP